MGLLSKFRSVSPNDEYSISSLNDKYINYVYERIYSEMYRIAKSHYELQPRNTLEIGAGSLSKADNYFSGIKQSDGSSVSRFGKENQLIAENLPYENSTFDVILAKDTLHHFNDINLALSEISRVLKPGGVFIVSEPYWSILGRLVFKYIHPEKWETKPKELKNSSKDPFDANQASLLCLKSPRFNKYISGNSFSMEEFGSTYGLSYLLSGGLNWRNSIPFIFLRNLDSFESKVRVLKFFTGLNIIVAFKKCK